MYEKALELNHSNYQVMGNLGSAYSWIPDKREKAVAVYLQAIEMAEKALTIDPQDIRVLTDLTEYYSAIKDIDKADSMAQKVLALASEDWDVLLRIGVAFETLGRRDSALTLLGRSLDCGGPAEYLKNIPELNDLRDDPRYRKIINSISGATKDTI
jgi:Flp pilus assembly protein TadD